MSTEKIKEYEALSTVLASCNYLDPNLRVGILKNYFLEYKDVTKDGLENFTKIIVNDINQKSGLLHTYFFILIDICYIIRGSIIACEESWFHKRVYNRFKQAYFKNHHEVEDFGRPGEKNIAEFHENLANQQRANTYYKNMHDMHQLPVENENLYPCLDMQPIIIEEVFYKPERESLEEGEIQEEKNEEISKIEECSGCHLVILVHGYEGCSYDMKLVKNSLQYF